MDKDKQITSKILMVRPKAFRFNAQTAKSNAFQHKDSSLDPNEIQAKALVEFDVFAAILKEVGLHVEIFDDLEEFDTPDALFPNNWISTHSNNTLILYPLLVENRRKERRADIVNFFQEKVPQLEILDYTSFESKKQYLESTGSIVMDRVNQIAYASISPRTEPKIFHKFCSDLDCKGILFHSKDQRNIPVYHTNVMMALGKDFALICLEAIPQRSERNALTQSLSKTGHEVIEITLAQLHQFAGNMLQVKNKEGKTYLVMSKRAHDSLGTNQLEKLRSKTELLVIPIDVIETNGGGSVRCMMAEIFLDY